MQIFKNNYIKWAVIIIGVIIIIIAGYSLIKKKTTKPAPVITTPVITGTYEGSFATSTRISWKEGSTVISIQKATFADSKLTLFVRVVNPGSSRCVPLNLGLIKDESGNVQKPDTTTFAFPLSKGCQIPANTNYDNQPVVFTLSKPTFPLLFSTQGESQLFFEVSTTTNKGLKVELPATVG